jgi:hypothetical protein
MSFSRSTGREAYDYQESINIAISTDMDVKTHWEKVYQTKAPDTVSWYRPHLETSLALIERAGATPSSAIIDVGAGESTLADDLLSLEFQNITFWIFLRPQSMFARSVWALQRTGSTGW